MPTHTNHYGYVIETKALFGKIGHGAKVHALIAYEIVGLTDEARVEPGTYGAQFMREERRAAKGFGRRPVYFSVRSCCNGNGQHTATPVAHFTAEHVSCERCQEITK
jgi:hypothetical protein